MAAPPASPRYGPELRDLLLAGFQGAVAPVRVGPLYRLGLAVVAVVMVLLPLAYLALIAAAGWGVYAYLVHVGPMLAGAPTRLRIVALAGPPVAGGLLVLFMLASMWPRRAPDAASWPLRRDREPLLYQFVETLSRALGAPAPGAIRVDLQANASAGPARGLVSLLRRDLVLTLGLPLVSALSVSQLAGVMAHELGHFAQRGGMSSTYLIRLINGWFYRVVHERGRFDAELERTGGGLFVQLVVSLSRLLLWLSRRVLWLLMVTGHAVSSFMLRQMENDADLYEARLVGQQAFAATMREILLTAAAHDHALGDLDALWREGRLTDSVPALVELNLQQLRPQLAQGLEAHLAAARTGWFDTHPAPAERIARTRRTGSRGVFRSDLPATVLFHDFAETSRAVSLGYYREALGREVEPGELVHTEAIERRREQTERELEGFERYFRGAVGSLRPLPLPAELPPPPAGSSAGRSGLVDELAAARREVERDGGSAALAYRRFTAAEEHRIDAEVAGHLAAAGVSFDPAEYRLTRGDERAAEAKRSRVLERRQSLGEQLAPFERACARRLTAALRLAAGARPETVGGRGGLAEMLDCLVWIDRRLERLHELRCDHAAAGALWRAMAEDRANRAPASRIEEVMDGLYRRLEELWLAARGRAYPTADAAEGRTLHQATLEELPAATDPVAVFQGAEAFIRALYDLHQKLLLRLVAVAAEAEQAAGLPPPPPLAEPGADAAVAEPGAGSG